MPNQPTDDRSSSADDRPCATAARRCAANALPGRRHCRGRLVAAVLALLLGGCASAPVVRWHSLLGAAPDAPAAPVGNAVAASVIAGAAPWLLQLSVTRVPVAADQQQWLVRLPDDTLRLLEEERWAAPLRDELRAALVQGLVGRWGATDVGGRPFEPTTDAIRDALPQPGAPPTPSVASAASGASSNRPARPAVAAPPLAVPNDATPPAPELRRVTVDVTRFESLPDREARLEAEWTVVAAPRGANEPAPPLLACRSAFREPAGAGAPALAAAHRRAVAALADAIGRAAQAGRGAVCPPSDGNSGR